MAVKNGLDASYLVDDAPEPDEPETPGGETPEEPPAETPETPAAAAPVSRTPITRRQRAKERDESILKELKETREMLSKVNETQAERFARLERENAELRGHVQGLASRPAPESHRDESPDPDKLLDEANALLDKQDFRGYQRKYAEYVRTGVRLPAQAQQTQAGPQVNPMLQMVASNYVDVMSNRAAFEIAQAHDRILSAQGIPESPERWKKAFDEGRRYMGGQQKTTPSFSTKSREVLSGVPTSRNGAASSEGAGEPGVTLSPEERKWQKRSGMSEAEYAKHVAAMHPERVERG